MMLVKPKRYSVQPMCQSKILIKVVRKGRCIGHFWWSGTYDTRSVTSKDLVAEDDAKRVEQC